MFSPLNSFAAQKRSPCLRVPELCIQGMDAGEASACHSYVHLHCLIVIYWSSERIEMRLKGSIKPRGGRDGGWTKAWVGTRHMNLTDGVQADWVS